MLKLPQDNETTALLKSYVPNYKVNFLWSYNVSDFEKYHTGLRELFGALKNEESGKDLKTYIQDHNERFSNLDEPTYNVISSLLNMNKYQIRTIKNEQGGINMSQALEDIKYEIWRRIIIN